MLSLSIKLSLLLAAVTPIFATGTHGSGSHGSCGAKPPNIILILTDDQDKRMGSLDYQATLQEKLMAKGTSVNHHYGTVAQCCPAQTILLRGQAGHNTNNTHVRAPG